MKITDRRITVSTSSIGFHAWPEAKDIREYLSFRHRHLFHYRVTVPVDHDDRDIEFHDLLDIVNASPPITRREHGRSSCENLALEVAEAVFDAYPATEWVTVEVTEDDEVGATLTFEAAKR
jgi:hypothetical protein